MSTLEQYRNMLYINKHRLDDELEVQGDIMDRISTQVVRRNTAMLEAKDELAKIEGRLAEEYRDDSSLKLTAPLIELKVKRHPERTRAWEAYQRARAEHEAWAGLLEAWRQKGYSIKTLADLYAAQYFSLSSIQSNQRQRDVDDLRAGMRTSGHQVRRINPAEEIKPREEATPMRRRALT